MPQTIKCRYGTGIPQAFRYGTILQPRIRILGGTGYWTFVLLSAAGAWPEEREALRHPGEPDGDQWEASSGCAARQNAVGAQRGSFRRDHAQARLIPEEISPQRD